MFFVQKLSTFLKPNVHITCGGLQKGLSQTIHPNNPAHSSLKLFHSSPYPRQATDQYFSHTARIGSQRRSLSPLEQSFPFFVRRAKASKCNSAFSQLGQHLSLPRRDASGQCSTQVADTNLHLSLSMSSSRGISSAFWRDSFLPRNPHQMRGIHTTTPFHPWYTPPFRTFSTFPRYPGQDSQPLRTRVFAKAKRFAKYIKNYAFTFGRSWTLTQKITAYSLLTLTGLFASALGWVIYETNTVRTTQISLDSMDHIEEGIRQFLEPDEYSTRSLDSVFLSTSQVEGPHERWLLFRGLVNVLQAKIKEEQYGVYSEDVIPLIIYVADAMRQLITLGISIKYYNEAEACSKEYLELMGRIELRTKPENHENLKISICEMMQIRAFIAFYAGNLDEAIERQRDVIKRCKANWGLASTALTNLGYLLAQKQSYKEAISQLKAAIKAAIENEQEPIVTAQPVVILGRIYLDIKPKACVKL